MKVSTTSFLLASLYGSALAAPVGGDLGGALESVTNTVDLGNVVPGNAVPGNIDTFSDLTKGLTGAVGQPGNIVGRDGEQKASAVLPNYDFLATDHTADVNIKADATNVNARNLDAKAKAQPFGKQPADVNVGANLNTRNSDAKVNGVAGQLVDIDAGAKAHPFVRPPAQINTDANVVLTEAVASGVTLADNVAEPTGSVDSALEDATGPDVSGVQALPTGNL
ncbi:hypothetical protein NHJ13051_007424 [Beauveria bassiana]